MFLTGIAWYHRLWREIILTIRCIKSSFYTRFASTLAMSGEAHCMVHVPFTLYIYSTSLGYLLLFEMINSSLFYSLCALWWLLWTYFSDKCLGEVYVIIYQEYHTICHLLYVRGEGWRLVTPLHRLLPATQRPSLWSACTPDACRCAAITWCSQLSGQFSGYQVTITSS